MAQPTQQPKRTDETGVFRRPLELARELRALSEQDLRALLASGAIDELLDADDGDEEGFEY